MKSAYIITKPLQYINATNIPDENKEKDCYLINSFYQAENFYEYIKTDTKTWNKIKFIKKNSYNSRYYIFLLIILKRHKYSSFYTDFDYGTIHTLLFFFLRRLKIYTYEEGFGTYREFTDKSSISRKIKTMFGSKNWIGGNRFSKGGYYYFPHVMNYFHPESLKKEILPFSRSFFQHVNTLKEIEYFSKGIDFDKFADKDVCVYVTTWIMNPLYKEVFLEYPDYCKILKPHPHIGQLTYDKKDFDEVFKLIPAEILLMRIIKVARNVIVIHENSSTLIYLYAEQINNFKEINLRFDPKSSYNIIKEQIISSK